jgi:hypothetical protein
VAAVMRLVLVVASLIQSCVAVFPDGILGVRVPGVSEETIACAPAGFGPYLVRLANCLKNFDRLIDPSTSFSALFYVCSRQRARRVGCRYTNRRAMAVPGPL